MDSYCLSDELLDMLAEGTLEPEATLRAEGHLLSCPTCFRRYQTFSAAEDESLPTLASLYGSAIAVALPGPRPLPRGEVLALLEASASAGWKTSSMRDEPLWIVADVSSGKLEGDEVDVAKLMRFVLWLREQIPPEGSLSAYVAVGRGGMGTRGPFGPVFDRRLEAYSREMVAALSPGQLRITAAIRNRLLDSGISIRPLGADEEADGAVQLLATRVRSTVASSAFVGSRRAVLSGGCLDHRPIRSCQASIARSIRGTLSPNPVRRPASSSSSSPVHRLREGESLMVKWEAPQGASLHLVTFDQEGWQLKPASSCEEESCDSSRSGFITLEGASLGTPMHVWLLACSTPLTALDFLPPAPAGAPPSEEEAVYQLAERILSTHVTDGFMLFDVGRLERI